MLGLTRDLRVGESKRREAREPVGMIARVVASLLAGRAAVTQTVGFDDRPSSCQMKSTRHVLA